VRQAYAFGGVLINKSGEKAGSKAAVAALAGNGIP
jgi:hypothetical protein